MADFVLARLTLSQFEQISLLLELVEFAIGICYWNFFGKLSNYFCNQVRRHKHCATKAYFTIIEKKVKFLKYSNKTDIKN